MIQMKLKRKYRSAHKGRFNGGERPAPKKNRKKLNDKAKMSLKPQVKRCLYVNGLTGKGVFRDYEG